MICNVNRDEAGAVSFGWTHEKDDDDGVQHGLAPDEIGYFAIEGAQSSCCE